MGKACCIQTLLVSQPRPVFRKWKSPSSSLFRRVRMTCLPLSASPSTGLKRNGEAPSPSLDERGLTASVPFFCWQQSQQSTEPSLPV